MRIVVTGARGFLGGHAVTHLRAQGYDVVPLGRGDDGALRRLDGAGAVAGGAAVPLPDLLAGADAVVHLAARSVDSLATPLAAYLPANVVLTEDLVRAAADAGVGRFVLASSRLAYPGHLRGPIREDEPEGPDTFYGLSKRMGEDVLALYARTTGIGTVALRIAQVVGPGDGGRGALPRLVGQALAGGPVTVRGTGAVVRDFVDVRDVASALDLAATRPGLPHPLVANIGTGGFSVAEMAREVAAQCGLPDDAVVFEPVEHEDTSAYRLDTTRARDLLGWAASYGLAEMVRERVAHG